MHTLAFCPAWAEERRVMTEVMGRRVLSLRTLVEVLLEGGDN
jgi:hypothetical protein